MSVDTRVRKRGHPINGELLSQMMAARSLHAEDLARLARVSEDTISRARRGLPIGRDSLSRLAGALLAAPANPLLEQLTRKERAAGGQAPVAAQEVKRGPAPTDATPSQR